MPPPIPTLSGDDVLTHRWLEGLAGGVALFDEDLRLATWTRQFAGILDLSQPIAQPGIDFAMVARACADRGYLGPGDAQVLVLELLEAVRNGTPWCLVSYLADGRFVETTIKARAFGGMAVTVRDVTDDGGTPSLQVGWRPAADS
jgi:hypothetical protein